MRLPGPERAGRSASARHILHGLALAALATMAGCEPSPATEPQPQQEAQPRAEARHELKEELTAFVRPYVAPVKEVLARYAGLPLSGEPLSPETGWQVIADQHPERGYVAFETSRVSARLGHVAGRLDLHFARRHDGWYLVTYNGYLYDLGHEASELRRIYDHPPELHIEVRQVFQGRTVEEEVLLVELRPARHR
jgi:hypothetical protein